MGDIRRARPTIRCLIEDLGVELPGLDTDLGELEDPWIAELHRIAPTSPVGQKRILAIDHPLVYRLRVSAERGATWLDEDGVVWLCAVRRREEGSDDDAFAWFAELHQDGRLLPTDQDRRRDHAEEAVRSFGRLRAALFELIEVARDEPAIEHDTELDGWLPSRALVYRGDDVEEIWCAISVRAADGNFISEGMETAEHPLVVPVTLAVGRGGERMPPYKGQRPLTPLRRGPGSVGEATRKNHELCQASAIREPRGTLSG